MVKEAKGVETERGHITDDMEHTIMKILTGTASISACHLIPSEVADHFRLQGVLRLAVS